MSKNTVPRAKHLTADLRIASTEQLGGTSALCSADYRGQDGKGVYHTRNKGVIHRKTGFLPRESLLFHPKLLSPPFCI